MTGIIGRETELLRLEDAAVRGVRLIYVHGAAGEGKTSLVRQWLERRQAPFRTLRPADVASKPTGIVFLDDWTNDQEAALLDALRGEPRLQIVVCAREAPSLTLRSADIETLVLPLEPLSFEATCELLAHLPVDEIRTQFLFHHGHALTLRVLSSPDASASSERRRLLGQLLDTFLGDALSTEERIAVEALVPLRYVGEAQLQRSLRAHFVPRADSRATGASGQEAYELLQRLRRLSFVRAEPLGLSLHPTLREILLEDLAWRAPERLQTLVASQLPALRAELAGGGVLRERAIETLLDLIVRAPGAWISRAALEPRASVATRADHPRVVELVRAHEGDESAAICSRWLAAYPERCIVSWDDAGELSAVVLRALIDTEAVDLLDDLVTARSLGALAGRPRYVFVNRFMIGRAGYHALTAEVMPVVVEVIRDSLVTAHEAHVTVARAGDTSAGISGMGVLPLLPGTTTRIGAHDYVGLGGVLGGEVEAAQAFFLFVANQWGISAKAAAPTPLPAELERAVHAAIRTLEDPLSLARSPIAKLLAVDGVALQALLRDAITQIDMMPDGERTRRAVMARLRTGGTQEEAAASVAMSLATYKRFRKRGVQRVSEILWSARSTPRRE